MRADLGHLTTVEHDHEIGPLCSGETMRDRDHGAPLRQAIECRRQRLFRLRIDRRGRSRLNTEVGRVIRWAYLVRKEGIVSLDAEVEKIPGWDGGFLRFGVELITAGS